MIWLLIKLFAALPVDTASRFGERVGRWIGPRLKRKTRIFKENMIVAFPDLGAAELDDLIVSAWGRAGRILAEYPHLAEIGASAERLTLDIRQPSASFSNPEHPSVFVTSHQSNWELSSCALARLGIPSANLYSPPTNPYLDRMLLDSRRVLNCELLPRDNSTRLLMRAMKEGRSVGMVVDRRVDEGEPVNFFGRDKLSTLVPARLALKFNCDMVPMRVERLQDTHYRVTFYPPVTPSNPEANQKEQAMDMTQQLHRHFEDWVRQAPQDWFCSKRLWPKQQPVSTTDTTVKNDVNCHAA